MAPRLVRAPSSTCSHTPVTAQGAVQSSVPGGRSRSQPGICALISRHCKRRSLSWPPIQQGSHLPQGAPRPGVQTQACSPPNMGLVRCCCRGTKCLGSGGAGPGPCAASPSARPPVPSQRALCPPGGPWGWPRQVCVRLGACSCWPGPRRAFLLPPSLAGGPGVAALCLSMGPAVFWPVTLCSRPSGGRLGEPGTGPVFTVSGSCFCSFSF